MMGFLLAMALQAQAGEDPAIAEAITKFEAEYSKAKDPGVKAALIQNLARNENDKIVSKVSAYLSDQDKNVRLAAIKSLGQYTNATPELRQKVSHALASAITSGANNRDVDAKEALLNALGPLQDESSVNVLKSHYEDEETKVASAAVTSSGTLKCKQLIEPLITLLRECEKKANPNQNNNSGAPNKKSYAPKKGGGGGGSSNNQNDPEAKKRDRAANLIPVIQTALSTLTAQSFPTADDWEKWWSKNRGSFQVIKQ